MGKSEKCEMRRCGVGECKVCKSEKCEWVSMRRCGVGECKVCMCVSVCVDVSQCVARWVDG